jgi:hypothetical protein
MKDGTLLAKKDAAKSDGAEKKVVDTRENKDGKADPSIQKAEHADPK